MDPGDWVHCTQSPGRGRGRGPEDWAARADGQWICVVGQRICQGMGGCVGGASLCALHHIERGGVGGEGGSPVPQPYR